MSLPTKELLLQQMLAEEKGVSIIMRFQPSSLPILKIAMVGLTAEEAQEKGLNITIGSFPFQALGRSIANQ